LKRPLARYGLRSSLGFAQTIELFKMQEYLLGIEKKMVWKYQKLLVGLKTGFKRIDIATR